MADALLMALQFAVTQAFYLCGIVAFVTYIRKK
jgi:hypothetical protein